VIPAVALVHCAICRGNRFPTIQGGGERMKTPNVFFFCVLSLCLTAHTTMAVTIDYVLLFSSSGFDDINQVQSHQLWAGIELSGDPEQNALVKITKGTEERQLQLTNFFFDESNFQIEATAPPPEGFGGTPADFNGALLRFTITDPDTAPVGIVIEVTPSGFEPIQMMDNLSDIDGGLHPTVTWADPGPKTVHCYRIRVFDVKKNKVFDSPNFYYDAVGGVDGSFTFTLQDAVIGGRTVSGFTFKPGESYTIRIEARYWLDIADFGPGGDFIPTQSQAFYLNRSVTEFDYLSIPVADLDLDLDIDAVDLKGFSVAYASGSPAADLDGNGIVDGDDMSRFAAEFGRL
jgi:hypothetical protein